MALREGLMTDSLGRMIFVGICAWVSLCLLISGWMPPLGFDIRFIWMISGLTGLVSSVGLAQVIKNDISAQKRLLDEYMQAALTDGLTGLANRQALDQTLESIFDNYDPQTAPMSLIMFDIDYFKQFNDEWGHQAGDEVLRMVSLAAVRFFNKRGCVARYGGEEFAVALPNSRIVDAFDLAEEFREHVKGLSCDYQHRKLHVTISAGVAEAYRDDCPDTLIRRADTALYTAKRLGRDRAWGSDHPESQCSTEMQMCQESIPRVLAFPY